VLAVWVYLVGGELMKSREERKADRPLPAMSNAVQLVTSRIYELTTNPGELGKFIAETIAATDKKPGEFGKWLYPEVKAFMAEAKADAAANPTDETIDPMVIVKMILGVLLR